MASDDPVDLRDGDFRRVRRYLGPGVYLWDGDEPDSYPDPTDLVDRDAWEHVMDLTTDVALRSSSYAGSLITRLHQLDEDWTFSWPGVGEAPFMEYPALLASLFHAAREPPL